MNLDDELDRIFAARDRENMQPPIDSLLPLYASHSQNARVLYEVGGAYDTAGQEEAARGFAAVAALLELVVEFVSAPDIERYKAAISGNASYIRSLQGNWPELSA